MLKKQKGIGLIALILIIISILIIGGVSIFLIANNNDNAEGESENKVYTSSNKKEENVKEDDEDVAKNPYTLVVNNIEYSFPVSYNKFISSNWSLNTEHMSQEDFNKTVIKANENLYAKSRIPFKSNGIPLAFVYFINNNTDTEFKYLKECDVFGLTYNDIFGENNNDDGKWGYSITPGTVKIKNGNKEVIVGQSTVDEAISVLGEPFTTETISEKYSKKQYKQLVWMDYSMNWRVELLTEPGGDDTIQYFTFHNSVY